MGPAKVRDEGLVVLWTILTLGIYNLVLVLPDQPEMRDFGRAHGDEQLATAIRFSRSSRSRSGRW